MEDFDKYVKPMCVNDDKSKVRHSGGANGLFYDGHVEFLMWDKLDGDTDEEKEKRKSWFVVD